LARACASSARETGSSYRPLANLRGTQHTYLNPKAAVAAAPAWLLDRVFEPADTVDPSRPFPPRNAGRDAWSNAVALEVTNG
jgi:hypothetical protein